MIEIVSKVVLNKLSQGATSLINALANLGLKST